MDISPYDYAFEAIVSNKEQVELAHLRGRMEERRHILKQLALLESKNKKWKGEPKELARLFWGRTS